MMDEFLINRGRRMDLIENWVSKEEKAEEMEKREDGRGKRNGRGGGNL